MRLSVPLLLFVSVILATPTDARPNCDDTHLDSSARHVRTIGDVLRSGSNLTSREDSNASLVYNTLRSLHVDQLGFVDRDKVQIEVAIIPEAATPEVFELMGPSARARLSGLSGLIRTPADLPRGDRKAGLRARGFRLQRDSQNLYVIGEPHIGGKGQAVIVNSGNFGMRVITYDGAVVSYADVGLYTLDDSDYPEARYEVTDRVELVFPEDTPAPLNGF